MLPLRNVSSKNVTFMRRFRRWLRRLLRCHQSLDLFSAFKLILLIGATATAVLYYISLSWPVIIEDVNYGIISNSDLSTIKLDRKCSKISGNCFVVVDSIDVQNNKVIRSLLLEGAEITSDASVQLIAPRGVKVSESDTRIWPIDHTSIVTGYITVMSVAPMLISSLDLSKSSHLKASILCIGVGGGTIEMFLATKFPMATVIGVELEKIVVELATKWFGITDRQNYQLVNADGVAYLVEAARKRQQFDAILIDACVSDEALACPAPGFIDEQLIASISEDILKQSGTLVVNFMSMKSADREIVSAIKLFKQHFVKCVGVHLEEVDLILICFNKELPFNEPQQLLQQFDAICDHLHLTNRPDTIRIVFNL